MKHIINFIIILLVLFSMKNNVFGEEQLLAPNLIFPEHKSGYKTVPTNFVWNAVDNAEYYSIQITNDVTFLELNTASDILINNYSDTIYIPDTNKLIIDTMYFWRVKASNNIAESEWSFIRMFLTGYASIKEDNNKIQVVPMPVKNYAKIILDSVYDDLKCFIFTNIGILLDVQEFTMTNNIIDVTKCYIGNYYFVITSKNKIIGNKSIIIQ